MYSNKDDKFSPYYTYMLMIILIFIGYVIVKLRVVLCGYHIRLNIDDYSEGYKNGL